jgi:hypothetical protein
MSRSRPPVAPTPAASATSAEAAGDEMPAALARRLDRIEAALDLLVEREVAREWYETAEFARLVNKAEFTVREWCRLGRIKAVKRASGRGKHTNWVVGHGELLRYRREGLLPLPR